MEILNIILAAIAAIASVWSIIYAIRSNKKSSKQFLAAKEAELANLNEMLSPMNNYLDFNVRAQMELRKKTLEFEIKQLKKG